MLCIFMISLVVGGKGDFFKKMLYPFYFKARFKQGKAKTEQYNSTGNTFLWCDKISRISN